MRPDFNHLLNYCISYKSDKQQVALIRKLLQKALNNSNFELDDTQLIVSSSYSDEVITDVFTKIYQKPPQQIIVASDRSKIVRMK